MSTPDTTPPAGTAKPRRMPGQSLAFEQGYYAYFNDLAPVSECPYKSSGAERIDWLRGRIAAKESDDVINS